MRMLFAVGALAIALSGNAQAVVVNFLLTGPGGVGLTSGSQPVVPLRPGSGGIGIGGIEFDTVNNSFSMDIRWGSQWPGLGFSDLSAPAVTLTINGAPTSNSTNSTVAPVLLDLSNRANFTKSSTQGSFIGSLDATDLAASLAGVGVTDFANLLLAGNTYINVSTDVNIAGEIRGQLVAVPEPSGFALLSVLVFSAGVRRRRRFTPSREHNA